MARGRLPGAGFGARARCDLSISGSFTSEKASINSLETLAADAELGSSSGIPMIRMFWRRDRDSKSSHLSSILAASCVKCSTLALRATMSSVHVERDSSTSDTVLFKLATSCRTADRLEESSVLKASSSVLIEQRVSAKASRSSALNIAATSRRRADKSSFLIEVTSIVSGGRLRGGGDSGGVGDRGHATGRR